MYILSKWILVNYQLKLDIYKRACFLTLIADPVMIQNDGPIDSEVFHSSLLGIISSICIQGVPTLCSVLSTRLHLFHYWWLWIGKFCCDTITYTRLILENVTITMFKQMWGYEFVLSNWYLRFLVVFSWLSLV